MTLPVWWLYQSIIKCCAATAHRGWHHIFTHVHSSLVCQGLTNGGRAAGDEFQRTVGAFFAIYWLFRSSDHTWWRWKGNEMSRDLILYSVISWCRESIQKGASPWAAWDRGTDQVTGGLVTMAQFEPCNNFRQMRCLDTVTLPSILTVLHLMELPWQIDRII